MQQITNVTCVAIAGRGLLITGAPGRGKSSLAMALIDRSAVLVGDDGIALETRMGRAWAHPPAHICGQLEIRGVGIVDFPAHSAPVCLILNLDDPTDRLPELQTASIGDTQVPQLPFRTGDPLQAIRAEYALQLHGLPVPDQIV